LVVAAMIAAEMSSLSGYMLTWATVIYNDLVLPCRKTPLAPEGQLLLTRSIVVLMGIFLVFYGLWYQVPGNTWDYLAVTGNIYIASIFTLLVAALYWRKANELGAKAALVLGAAGPIAFLILGKRFAIRPEIAGASSFILAGGGMLGGSLWRRRSKT